MSSETQVAERINLRAPLPPRVRCITHAATFIAELPVAAAAPGEIVSLFGAGIGPGAPASAALDAEGKISKSLAGVSVWFNGTPAPLLYAGPAQINAIVPFEAAGWQSATVVVRKDGVDFPSMAVRVVPASPGIFSGGIVNQDNSPNSPQQRAPAGSIIQIWATGAGLMQPVPANGELGRGATRVAGTVRVTGHIPGAWHGTPHRSDFPLEVLYAGDAPGLPQGVIQINALLPNPIPVNASPDSTTISVSIADVDSPRIPLWIGWWLR